MELNWAKSANKADTICLWFVVLSSLTTMSLITDKDGYSNPLSTYLESIAQEKGNNWISIGGSKMPNTSNAKRPNKDNWYNEDYLCTVAELEQELGVKFFPTSQTLRATQVKSQKNRYGSAMTLIISINK